jgi:hypothetical protein
MTRLRSKLCKCQQNSKFVFRLDLTDWRDSSKVHFFEKKVGQDKYERQNRNSFGKFSFGQTTWTGCESWNICCVSGVDKGLCCVVR